MYELIILGLIPGTHIQITFALWLLVAIAVTSLIAGHQASQSKKLRQLLVVYYLVLQTKLPPARLA